MCTSGGWGVLGDLIVQLAWRFLAIRGGEVRWEGGPT